MTTDVTPAQEYLRIPQVAALIGMSTGYVRKVIRLKQGPRVIRMPGGKSPVVSRAELTRWMEAQAQQ